MKVCRKSIGLCLAILMASTSTATAQVVIDGHEYPPIYRGKSIPEICGLMIDNGLINETKGKCVGEFHRGIPERCSDAEFRKAMQWVWRTELKGKGDCIRLLREVLNTDPDDRIS